MNMMNDVLAYKAMFKFLDKYYQQTGADDVGALLGSLQLLEDGKPADSAMWDEWRNAVREALADVTPVVQVKL
ncbi:MULTISPECIES: hypothetical protein [unclassified Duganella]|jgi:hypothetical protein|uniref:hypothetical protein n=1 Tax=unclassified Duganella TaxID=2636909 RepID=UPI00087DFF40|nr:MULTISPECIES: hypothetical protein [unclassified Duganella]SDG41812.1 hypothetical protein SAMN05216320_104261 [Duganella sp. OV458]SDJ62266.1 hypothetical protein SAMN05428973_105143 [Duganella sp. OV510]